MEEIDHLRISELTLAQKLCLMEVIWNDLAKHEEALESPSRYEQALKDREVALTAGKATVSNWKTTKI
jgi:hypothetical protein